MREPVNKQRSRGEWEQLMARFDANGMTQSAFCTQQNVAYRSFCYWRKRLRTPEAVENPAALIRKLPPSSRQFKSRVSGVLGCINARRQAAQRIVWPQLVVFLIQRLVISRTSCRLRKRYRFSTSLR